MSGDFLGGLGGLVGQLLHFGSNDRKALAGLAGPRRLDGRIEGKQIGLGGDGLDEGDDLTDLVGGLGQRGDLAVAALRIVRRPGDDLGRPDSLGADLFDGRRQFLRTAGHRGDAVRRLA